jgi:hypothetical protein
MKKKTYLLFVSTLLACPHLSAGFGYNRFRNHGINKMPREEFYFWFLIGAVAIFTLAVIFTYSYRILIAYKARKAGKLIASSSVEDPMWDRERLDQFVRQTFIRFQNAFMLQDMKMIADVCDQPLRNMYQGRVNIQAKRKLYTYIERIEINKIKFVGITDSINNNKDKFEVVISGYMVHALMHKGLKPFPNHKQEKFEQLFYFERRENQWVLTDIDDEVSFGDIGIAELRKESIDSNNK